MCCHQVAVKFVVDMFQYHRQLRLHNDLKSDTVAQLADSYAAYRPAGSAPSGGSDGLHRGWGLPCLVLEYGECSLADFTKRGLLTDMELKATPPPVCCASPSVLHTRTRPCVQATFEGIVRAVLALHVKGFVHCGLQPESFRLYGGTQWRLANVETITSLDQPMPSKCPVCCAAPEVIRQLRVVQHGATVSQVASAPADRSVDVWSLGAILWQMFARQPLYSSESEALAMIGVLGSGSPPLGCVADLQARHLLKMMMARAPQERMSIERILKHGYLAGDLDTIPLNATFGRMQKGQHFVRSLLEQLSQVLGRSVSDVDKTSHDAPTTTRLEPFED